MAQVPDAAMTEEWEIPVHVDGDDVSAIVNGKRERGYDAAVGLGAGGFTLCSGSLITPRIVLTAGHCSADLPMELVIAFGNAYVGIEAGSPTATMGFSGGVIHPDYVPLTAFDLGHDDIAVLFLDQDAPIAPVWFRTEPLKPKEAEGADVVSVGWGLDENNQSNTKRSATLVVGTLDPVFLVSYSSGNDNSANICSGDSGGPQYHVEPNGTLVQWGVHSWGDVGCAYESGSTRTDKVADWILEQVQAEHGTTDRCEIFGQYGDGVCHSDCEQFDIDCWTPIASASTFPAGGCGCATGGNGLGGAALLLLLGVAVARRESARGDRKF